jgi:hypothetical protein
MSTVITGYPLEAAVAELVDNSLAAAADHVHIRFVAVGSAVQTLFVVDDGSGLTPSQIDAVAQDPGSAAAGDSRPLGLGLGLRAASFSQADSFTVFSIAAPYPATGRRWLAGKGEAGEGDIVGSGLAATEMTRSWAFRQTTGTTVRWDGIRGLASADEAQFAAQLSEAVSRLQHYLAVVYHRALERGAEISIDVEQDVGGSGPAVQVRALDPFGYRRTGAPDYPKTFALAVNGVPLKARCHIWPGRSQQPQFLLPNGSPERYQGIYFYRRDRLLQLGGWDELRLDSRDLQLARIAIDLDVQPVDGRAFVRDAQNDRVHGGPEFATSLSNSRADDGTTFEAYLDTARQIFAKSHSRNRARAQVTPLGRGLPTPVKRTVERELDPLSGHPGVDLRWRNFTDDVFFDIDRESNAIWLNSRYRNVLGGRAGNTFNDAPLVKTLLFLLVENLFHNRWWGAQDKDKLELWQTLLTSAAKEQLPAEASEQTLL